MPSRSEPELTRSTAISHQALIHRGLEMSPMTDEPQLIRMVLADDHAVVSEGTRVLLERESRV